MTRITLAAILAITAVADAATPPSKPRIAYACVTDPDGAVECHEIVQSVLCERLRGVSVVVDQECGVQP